MVKDELGKRMKEFYEQRNQSYLIRRMPVAVRIDGKAFHTFTRHFKKPFDENFSFIMKKTMKYLCENVQGCVFGYTQSDEITLILVDYQTLETSAFFDYNVQKLTSIISSLTTMIFNKMFYGMCHGAKTDHISDEQYFIYQEACEKGALFDCRVFNIPREEVTNLIYWRQLDAMRNSVNCAAQFYFSQKQLNGLSCKQEKELLMEKGINFDDYYPADFRKGSCCYKKEDKWIIDYDMPILVKEDREFVDKLI